MDRICLIGYVRIMNREEIFESEQDSNIHEFANKEDLEIAHIEHEVSNGVQLMRLGLWKALRLMTCRNCPPKNMPMADMYEYWFKEAIRPCTCKKPSPAQGLIADNIGAICTTPTLGAKFTLDMCANMKHVFVAEERRCLSCCNPQALKFLKSRPPGK